MKRIALFLAVVVAAIACNNEEAIVPEVTVKTAEADLVLPQAGDEVWVEFTSNVDWTAALKEAEAADYWAITPKSGLAGDGKVRVTVYENDTNENRTATLVITAETAVKEIVLTQLQKNALVAGSTALTVGAEGGEVKVKVAHNVDFNVAIDADWLTQTKAMTETELVFTAAASKELEERTATITITAGDLTQKVTVTQDAFVPTFEMDKAEIWVPAEGGAGELNITANFDYELSVDADWLTVTNEGGKYTFTATANAGFYYRAVEVMITGWSSDENKFYVFQNGRANVAWQKVTNTDYSWELKAEAVRMVVKGDYAILSNASNVVKVVDKNTGAFLKDITLPEAMVVNSLDLDDAGNIVLAGDFPWGGSTIAYYVSDLADPQPIAIGTLSNLNYWSGNPTGNFRVKGDVTKNATIVGIIGGVHQYMAFEVKDGEFIATENWGPVYQPESGTIWLPQNAGILPLGTAIADGFIYVAYSKPYDIYKINADGCVSLAHIEGFAGNEIPNALDLKEIDGKKLLAVGAGAVFTWSGSGVHVYDVTDMSNITLVGRWLVPDASSTAVNAGESLTKHGQGSDVVLEDTADGFRIYHFSAGNQRLTCVDVK